MSTIRLRAWRKTTAQRCTAFARWWCRARPWMAVALWRRSRSQTARWTPCPANSNTQSTYPCITTEAVVWKGYKIIHYLNMPSWQDFFCMLISKAYSSFKPLPYTAANEIIMIVNILISFLVEMKWSDIISCIPVLQDQSVRCRITRTISLRVALSPLSALCSSCPRACQLWTESARYFNHVW